MMSLSTCEVEAVLRKILTTVEMMPVAIFMLILKLTVCSTVLTNQTVTFGLGSHHPIMEMMQKR